MILIQNNGTFRHISKKEAEKIYLDQGLTKKPFIISILKG